MKRTTRKAIFAFVILSTVGLNVYGQQDRARPFFRLPVNDLVHPQTWAFAQDSSGSIYVGHTQGVAVFDGVEWSELDFPTKTVARSLLVIQSRVYVGLRDDFGYFDYTNAIGSFVSLADGLPDSTRIGNVWGIHQHEGKVVFQTSSNLFIASDDRLDVVSSETGFHTSFQVGDRVFVRERQRGLFELTEGRLVHLPITNFFADKKIYMMVESNDGFLIGTRAHGIFDYTHGKLQRLSGKASEFAAASSLYSGIRLKSGNYVLATLKGGVGVIDSQGELIQTIETNDTVINVVFEDAAGGLWIGTHNNGPFRIDFQGPLAGYTSETGLDGAVYDMARWKNTFLAATGAGLFRLGPGSDNFESDDRFAIARALVSTESSYAVGLEAGLFVSNTNRVDSAFGTVNDVVVDNSEKLIVAAATGLYTVAYRGNVPTVNPIAEGNYRSALAGSNNETWAVTLSEELHLVREPIGVVVDVDLKIYDDTRFSLRAINDEPVLFSETKIVFPTLMQNSEILITDHESFPPETFADAPLLDLAQHPDGSIWAVTADDVLVSTKQDDGTYLVRRHPYLSFKRGLVSRIFFDRDGIVWISDGDELVRYDPGIQKSYEAKFPAIVRKVTISQTDSVVYGRASLTAGAFGTDPRMHFEFNDLSIEFSSPEFNKPEETLYQYKLVGRSDEWSDWSKDVSVDYNNLREGSYQFIVRSKNFLGYVSPEGEYAFTILPPWYRSWWAYCLLSFTLLTASFLALKYYHMLAANKRAQEQARELARERIVNERLQDANEQLQVANTRLHEVNSLKDEFLANTSHELRTPITAIIGYSAVLKEELKGTQKQFVEVIENSSQRLMHTLNMVLDLSQLRSGTVELVPVKLDLSEEVNTILVDRRANWPQSEAKLVTNFPNEEIFVTIDRHALGSIVENLMDNAFKFTSEGEIQVTIDTIADRAFIRVSDDGVGMDPSFVPFIFDEFRQESDGLARTFEGNGLGLAVAARMVELSDGTIEVESTQGVGSTFTVVLPLADVAEHVPTGDRPAIARSDQQANDHTIADMDSDLGVNE